MASQRVLMVVDMQNGVFETPRVDRERCVAQINRLIHAVSSCFSFSITGSTAGNTPCQSSTA